MDNWEVKKRRKKGEWILHEGECKDCIRFQKYLRMMENRDLLEVPIAWV